MSDVDSGGHVTLVDYQPEGAYHPIGRQALTPPKRTEAQKHQDAMLDRAEEVYEQARRLIEEGDENLMLLGVVPANRNVAVLCTNLVEQVKEIRRIRG